MQKIFGKGIRGRVTEIILISLSEYAESIVAFVTFHRLNILSTMPERPVV